MSDVAGTWADSVNLAENVLPMAPEDLERRLEIWLPDLDNFKPQQFAMGLQANREEFKRVESLITGSFNSNQLSRCDGEDSLKGPTADDNVKEIVNMISDLLLKIFPQGDKSWIETWLQTIFTMLWREGQARRAREEKLPTGKSPVSSNPSAPPRKWWKASYNTLPAIASNDPDLVHQPLTPERTPTTPIYQSILCPIHEQVNFSLDGFTDDRKQLFENVEIVSTRCVLEGNDAKQINNYLLSIFIDQFEETLNEGQRGKKINLRHGNIGYWKVDGQFKKILRQTEFEDAINHMLTTTPGKTLKFCYHNENPVIIGQRLWEEKDRLRKAAAAARTGSRAQPELSTPSPGNSISIRSGSRASPCPQFVKQPNTKARISNLHYFTYQASPKRNSIVSRGINSFIPRKRKPVPKSAEGNVFSSREQSAAAHLASSSYSSNAVISAIKRVVRVKPQPASQAPKIDNFEAHRKRFEGLFELEETTRFKRGGTDDLKQEVKGLQENEKEGESDETNDEEEEEESAEFMVNNLQKIFTDPELAHLHPTRESNEWKVCCQLFQIDPSKTGVNDTVNVFGLTKPLYQYQAFAVFWQMKNSRVFGGGFLADDPGLGKTLTYLAFIVIERQLSWLWNDVTESRAKNDGRHLQAREHRPNDECPSAAKFQDWIACPCRSSSPTSKMQHKPGIRLAVVPDNLVDCWKKAFQLYVRADTLLEMRLVIASPANNPPGGGGFGVLDSRHPTSHNALRSDRTKVDNKFKYENDKPHLNQERCLVVTTAFYYKTWIKEFEYKATYKICVKNGSETWVTGKNPGIVFGIAMIDECHEEGHWQKGMGRSNVLADLPKLNRPYLWGYSGTPFSTTPRTLEGMLWALETHYPKKKTGNRKTGWEETAGFVPFSHKEFDKICINFQALNQPLGTPDAKFRQLAKSFFDSFKYILQSFMLRRTADMQWFGRPLLVLKPHLHSDIRFSCNSKHKVLISQLNRLTEVVDGELVDKLKEAQDRWEKRDDEYKFNHSMPQRLTFNTERKVQWRLRILATFPYLVTLADTAHDDHLDLTVAEFVEIIGPREKESPYYKHLKAIVESSSKAMWLHKFILELMQQKDVHGQEQKLVIVTNFSPVALILKMFLEKYVKGAAGRVGAIYAGVKQRERTAIIESFTDAIDEKGNRRQRINFQFLIGTTRFLSTGLQLTRACNIVLMEPDFDFSREVQTYSRVHRIGQQNAQTFSYRLINQRDHVERMILERQALRNEFPGKPIVLSNEWEVEDDPAIAQYHLAEKDKPRRQLHTDRTSREENRSDNSLQPEQTVSARSSKHIIPRRPVRVTQLWPPHRQTSTQAGPSDGSASRGRSTETFAKAIDNNKNQITIPKRISRLSASPQSVALGGPSRIQSQARDDSMNRGSKSRVKIVARKRVPAGVSPVTRLGRPGARGQSAERGSPRSRDGIVRTSIYEHSFLDSSADFSPKKSPEGLIETASTPNFQLPNPSNSPQSGSSTWSYSSGRINEVATRIRSVASHQPNITDRPLPTSPGGGTKSAQVSPSDAGTCNSRTPSDSSPGQASIRSPARASSEALPEDELPRIVQQTNHTRHEIATDASASRAHRNQADEEIDDEILDSILLAQFPDSPTITNRLGGMSRTQRASERLESQEQEVGPRTRTRSDIGTAPKLVDGIPTLYAEITDPPNPDWPLPNDASTLFGPSSNSSTGSGSRGSVPVLRRVGNLEVSNETGSMGVGEVGSAQLYLELGKGDEERHIKDDELSDTHTGWT